MATDAQIVEAAHLMWDARWTFVKDMNGDGVVSISDIWIGFKWFFFAPGDFVILTVMLKAPAASRFLEIDGTALFGWVSGALSALFFMVLFTTFGVTADSGERVRSRIN